MKKSTTRVEVYSPPRSLEIAVKFESVVCNSTGFGTTEEIVIGEEESW